MDRWADDDEESVISGGEQNLSDPQAALSASQLDHLRDAIDHENGVWSSSQSATRDSTSRGSHVPQLRNSVLRDGPSQSAYEESPRRRNTRTTPSTGSEFIMPSVERLPSNDRRSNVRSTPQLPPIQRKNAQQRRTSPPKTRSRHFRDNRSTSKEYRDDQEATDWPRLLWTQIILPILWHAISVLGIVLSWAMPVIKYALALMLIVSGLVFLRNFATTTIGNALTPICRIPGASFLNLSFCETFDVEFPKAPAEFDKLLTAQNAFDEIFSVSVAEGHLSLDMKRSEASIRDLRTVVKYSNLPSRNELVLEFDGFVETAAQASRDLSRFNTRIGRGVDKILSTNKWTLQVLDGIADAELNRGSVAKMMSNMNVLAPLMPRRLSLHDLLLEQYLRHTVTIQDEIHDLIMQAQVLLDVLENLDARMDYIGDVAIRDGIKTQGNKEELLAFLWTKLGGNRSSVARIEGQLNLLRDVSTYRRLATAHVAGTIVKLQDIQANLQDLRERVTEPELVGVGNELPLEMHIYQIGLGVERLERLRNDGRAIGDRKVRDVLDKEERPAIDA